MTTERIDIIVSERGSRVVKRNLEGIGGGASTAANAVKFLQRTLAVLGSGLLLRELQQQADTYTLITNRLRLVTDGTENLRQINERLFESAQRTRTSYEATVDLYARVARNAGQLGLSQERLLAITETVNQAIRVSGGTAQEAAAGVRQFGQAIGSGALRGDELISVLENMPRLAQAIAEGMGVTIGQLRDLGAEGALTADKIIAALEATAPELAREFEQLTPTIGEAFTVLSNSTLRFIGELDQALGISEAFANLMIVLANHLDTVAKLAAVAGIALASAFTVGLIGRVAGTISQVIALERALGATTTASALFSAAMKVGQRAVVGLTAAIAANPIGLLIVAITTVIGLLTVFRDDIKVTSDGVVSLGDVFRAVFSIIGDIIRPVVEFFKDAWDGSIETVTGKLGDFLNSVLSIFGAILNFVKTIINSQIALWVGSFKTIVGVWNLLPAAFEALGSAAINGLIDIVDAGISGIVQGVGNLLEFIGSAFTAVGLDNPFAGLFDEFETGLSRFRIEGAPAVGAVFGEIGGIASREFSEAFGTDFIGTALNTVLSRAREIAEARAANTGEVSPGGTIPGDPNLPDVPGAGGAGSGGSAKLNEELQRMLDILEDITGPAREYQEDLKALDTLLNAGAITAQEYADKWREIRLEFLETQNTFAAGLERGILKVQEDLNDVASDIERVFTNAFGAAEDALTEFVKTGKLDFNSLITSIIDDLIRLSVRQTILGGFGNILSSLFSGGGGGGGLGGLLGSVFSGIFGGGGIGFATGGGFTVGGGGGVDSQLVQFRASPGERVEVKRPGEQGNEGGQRQQIVFNIQTQDAESFRKSESQIAARMARLAQRGRRNL